MGNAQASVRGDGRVSPSTAAASGPLRKGLLDQSAAAPNGNGREEENVPVVENGAEPPQLVGQQENETPGLLDRSAAAPNGNGREEEKVPVVENGAEPPQLVRQQENEPPGPTVKTSIPFTTLFPIPEDYMIEMLPAYAKIALYGLTTFNLLVANTVAPLAHAGIVQSLLYMCPYTYIPLGVISAILATVATKCRRFAGVSSGFMLVQLMYVIALGGFSTIIRTQLSFSFKTGDKYKDTGSKVVLGFSIGLCVLVLVGWSLLLPYPKCICFWNRIGPRKLEGAVAAMALSAEATEAAGVAYRAARDAVAIAKVARSDAKSAKEAAADAIAAEDAGDQASDAERDAAEAASKASEAAQGANDYAIAAEKAADEARERCRRAQVAFENAEKSLQDAQAAEDKSRLLCDPVNRV